MKNKVRVKIKDPHTVMHYRGYPVSILEMNEWCVENIGPKNLSWTLDYNDRYPLAVYSFNTEEDQMAFILVNSQFCL